MNLNPIEIAVTIGGVVMIVAVLFGFRTRRWKSNAMSSIGYQEVLVQIVEDRFLPSTIVLAAGVPAKIRFQRMDDAGEWESITSSGLSIERKLPAAKTTTIDITADEPGVHPFHSSVVRRDGTIIVARMKDTHPTGMTNDE